MSAIDDAFKEAEESVQRIVDENRALKAQNEDLDRKLYEERRELAQLREASEETTTRLNGIIETQSAEIQRLIGELREAKGA